MTSTHASALWAPASLDDWREAFAEQELACPWPGPRPFSDTDLGSLLKGRDEDSERFRQEVASHRLVFLDGESGVGKTSLLQAKLVPELRASGFVVAVCREWGAESAAVDPIAFLAGKIRAALQSPAGGMTDLPSGDDLFLHLEDTYGGRAVIVLDQFEELIRYSESLTSEVFDLLLDLNHAYHLKVVVSLRSDYLHRLRPLERAVKPFTLSKYALDTVKDEHIKAIVEAPGPSAIDPAAVAVLVQAWQEAREQPWAEGGELGLLHLQALLYTLNARAGGEQILEGHIEVLRAGGTPASLFGKGLTDAVGVKLDRCRSACGSLNSYLVEGAAQYLARIVPHLSSAGFKLHRDTGDLARMTLADEFERLTVGIAGSADCSPAEPDARLESLLSVLLTSVMRRTGSPDSQQLDVLAADRATIAAAADDLFHDLRWSAWLALDRGGKPDPKEVTSGPMLGLAPAAVFIEEMRRFALALAWLDASSLVRLTAPGSSGTVVSLIHDRFGEALARWSGDVLDGPQGALVALTAPAGASFAWRRDDPAFAWPAFRGESSHRVIANIRWRGAWVSAVFDRVIFVNCDLRGTVFSGSSFKGVAFVNCLLDGVMFSTCHIDGAPGPTDAGWDVDEPCFEVQLDDTDVARSLRKYRGEGEATEALFSPVAGMTAVPVDLSAELLTALDVPETTTWAIPDAGLVVYGGRVSALVVRKCTFSGSGMFSLRHVAGSGFDVVEQQEAAHFEVIGSALRHATFCAASGSEPDLTIDIRGTALAQVWLGERVQGRFTAEDCQVVHIWNGSEATAVVRRSSYHGLVSCTPDEAAPMLTGERAVTRAEVDPSGEFARRGSVMDYREDPSARRGSGHPRV